MIAAGERIEISDELQIRDMQVRSDTPSIAAADLLDRLILRYEAIIDVLESKLEESEASRHSAEVEAARLAGWLESVYRRHWWQVWRLEKPKA